MNNSWIFYKDTVTKRKLGMLVTEFEVGTYWYSTGNYYLWMKVITVRTGKVWAKVALRNVPKKYRALLLLIN